MTEYNDLYKTETLKSWDDLLAYFHDHPSAWRHWVFRGQRCDEWELESSLERAAIRRFQVDWERMPVIEDGMLRRFKRQLHQYISDVPEPNQTMEWLALMQHYGTPTRLLNWTYSFFVGAFFALESTPAGGTSALWALDWQWWSDKAKRSLPRDVQFQIENDPNVKQPETVDAILKSSCPLIHQLNPFRLNERLVIQQGVFIVPGDIKRSYMDNIRALRSSDDDIEHLIKLKIICTKDLLEQALEELHRMNVNKATLFPGLEGFAKHLENLIAIPNTLPIDKRLDLIK